MKISLSPSVDSSHIATDAVFQGQPFEISHSDRRLIALLADFVDRADIGMVRNIAIWCFASGLLKEFENCDISHRLCRPASLS